LPTSLHPQHRKTGPNTSASPTYIQFGGLSFGLLRNGKLAISKICKTGFIKIISAMSQSDESITKKDISDLKRKMSASK
jgi:hypothetical protein